MQVLRACIAEAVDAALRYRPPQDAACPMHPASRGVQRHKRTHSAPDSGLVQEPTSGSTKTEEVRTLSQEDACSRLVYIVLYMQGNQVHVVMRAAYESLRGC